MKIHAIDESGKVSSNFRKIPVSKEEEMEDFIENNPDILQKDLMIIGRQVDTDEGKTLDLMGLDNEGNVVIIELKKDLTPRDVIAQVLDYAVWAEDLTVEDLNTIAKRKHLTTNNYLWEKFQDQSDTTVPEFNQTQTLYVVGEEIDLSTKKKAEYLRKKGIDIYCIQLNFHEKDGNKIAITEEIVGEKNAPVRSSVIPSSEEDHLKKGSKFTQHLYQLLNEEVLKLGTDIQINPVGAYIGFVRKKIFLSVKIRKDFLRITIVAYGDFNDPKNITKQLHKWRENLYTVPQFNHENQLPDIMNLIKQTYKSN